MRGAVHKGKLPPVVSSLFSIKAAHWRDGIRGTELGARGKERTARTPRYQLSGPKHGAGSGEGRGQLSAISNQQNTKYE